MGQKRKTTIDASGNTKYLCCKCKEYKVEEEFSKRSDNGRLRSECKECRNKSSKLYHRTARLRMSEEDAVKDILKISKFKADPMISVKRYLIKLAKISAKNRGIEFNLSTEDIIIPKKCPILNKEFDPKSFKYTYSIDRLNNSKGYLSDNIRIISRLANLMKSSASDEELLTFAKNIKSYIKR